MPELVEVDAGGRIHVPREIVSRMGLKSGDVAIIRMEGRKVVMVPAKVTPRGEKSFPSSNSSEKEGR